MKLLAVESATLSGGVALLDGDSLLGEITLNIAITHSERLLSAVDRLLADCGLAPADLEGLAVSVGPGSFTGLRVGLATVKGLAMALGLPVAPVPTLDALAARRPPSGCRRPPPSPSSATPSSPRAAELVRKAWCRSTSVPPRLSSKRGEVE